MNTASTAGLIGFPGSPEYSASKGGVIQLTRTAALEYAKAGIRVNAICPGTVRTPMMLPRIATADLSSSRAAVGPIGRLGEPELGEPEEIAEAVVWLCSDAASFVTGHPMVIDGGYVAQ